MGIRWFTRAALAALLVSVPAVQARAQQTGQISGVVSDSASGAPLSAAQVSIAGTTLGAMTNAEGSYLIVNVPAGTHTLVVRRLGFQQRQIPGVAVTAGGRATANAQLRTAAPGIWRCWKPRRRTTSVCVPAGTFTIR